MLELVRLDSVDSRALWQLLADPRLARHMPLHDSSITLDWVEDWVRTKCALWPDAAQGPWAVVQSGALIGWAGFQPEADFAELAIVLAPAAWGLGQATYEMVRARWREVGEPREQVIFLPESRNPKRWINRIGCELAGELEIDGHKFLMFKLPPA